MRAPERMQSCSDIVNVSGDTFNVAARQFDGLHVFETIADRSESHRVRYTAEAAGLPVTFDVRADGTALLSIPDPTTGVSREIGYLDQPWAFDAEGNQVDTRYRVIGGELALDVGAALFCQNSKGFDIHSWGIPPASAIWCSGY